MSIHTIACILVTNDSSRIGKMVVEISHGMVRNAAHGTPIALGEQVTIAGAGRLDGRGVVGTLPGAGAAAVFPIHHLAALGARIAH